MRIVFLAHTSSFYGVNRSLLDLIDELKDHNVFAHVICISEGPLTTEMKLREIPFVVIPFRWWTSKESSFVASVKRLIRNLQALPLIVRQIRFWKADIVYSNSSSFFIGMMAAKIAKLPHVWHLRELGGVRYDFKYDWGRWFSLKIIRCSDACIVASNAVKTYFFAQDDSSNVHFIYAGVARISRMERVSAEAEKLSSVANESKVFLMVDWIHPSNQQDVAIRAISIVRKKFPLVKLWIVGEDGDPIYFLKCKKLLDELDIKANVTFLGAVAETTPFYLKASATIVCACNEAMGWTTLESMVCRRPVIGLAQGGTAELIQDDVNGLLYNGSENELAACMERLFENPEKAGMLSRNAARMVARKFTTEIYSNKIYEILQTLVKKESHGAHQLEVN